MRRKILNGKMMVVLAVLLVLFTAIGVAEEDRLDASGQWWYVLEGEGAFIFEYEGKLASDLVIPDELDGYPVTGFGNLVIGWSNEELTSVSIPDTVTSIVDYAFMNCYELTSVKLPAGLLHVGESAFDGCYLTNLTLPDGLLSIGNRAFSTSLMESVTIPDSVTSIGDSVFEYCSNLTSATIPASVTHIGDYAFVSQTVYDEILLSVEKGSIAEQYAIEYGLPYTYIGDASGAIIRPGEDEDGDDETDSWRLEDDDGGYRTDTAGQWTYMLEDGGAILIGCSEVPTGDLVIPGELGGYTVTGFGGGLFNDCTELTSVTLPQGITSIGDGMFTNCAALTRVVIPDSVQHIGFRAFAECSSLSDVTIPDSVMSIDEGAFALCESLTSLTIPDSVASLGEEAFLACSGLTSIVIPDSLTSINGHLFRACESLTSVIIPNSVTNIGEEAFLWCYSLSSVTIPASVTNIGKDAFDGCDELTLTVTKGSYAEQCAKENDIPYVLATK